MLSEKALLLKVTISIWGGTKTDRETSNEILQSKHADEKAGYFIKHILGGKPQELKAIQNMAHGSRMRIKDITLPYNRSRSTHIVPTVMAEEIISKMENERRTFDELVDKFLRRYPTLLEEAREKGGELFNEGDCPTPEEIRQKFGYHYHFEPIPKSNDFDEKLGDPDLEQRLMDQFQANQNEVLLECEQELLNRMVTRLRYTYEAIRDHSERTKKTSLRNNVIENTRELFDLAKRLNIRNNSNITNWCNRTIGALCRSAEELRNNQLWRREVVHDLGTILREMGQTFEEDQQLEMISQPIIVQEFNNAFAEL